MNRLRRSAWVVVVGALCAGVAAGAPPRAERRAHSDRATVIDVTKQIDINNIAMFVTNTGSFAFDKGNQVAGLEFPKGTAKTAVFAAGLWIGGKIGGKVKIALSEYSDEYGPGIILPNGQPDDKIKPEYKVYKLNRVYSDLAERDAALADYNAGAVPHGAPPVTVQGDGTLDILGDQMMWAVYNDADPTLHINRAGHTRPLGLEIQQTTFAFSQQGALNNTIFIKYRIINKGSNTLDSMFVSQWSDPDLGGASDDLVGCDTTLSVGFVYNATNNDATYGSMPPCVGYDFFRGPVNAAGDTLGLTAFTKYINGTDPNDSTKSYNYLTGINADGTPIINPVTGQPTHFMVSGDPVTGSGWLDTNPADRRLQLSSGPFRMAPGDTQQVVVGLVIGQSARAQSRLGAISLMKFYDRFAQSAFDRDFNLPRSPSPPKVTSKARDGSVFLSWDNRAETYNQPPYEFQGYVVYQAASIAGPFVRVATFDKVDGITTVLDDDFNEEQGLILPTGKAFGQDVGLHYQIELSQDAVRGGPLFNGQRYYFSVNAYAVGIGQFPQVLESAFNAFEVNPGTPAAGTDLSTSGLSAVEQHQYNPALAATTDLVVPSIVDPDSVITASWKVGFKPACDTCSGRVWYLTETRGAVEDTVLNNLSNFSNDEAFPVVAGIQTKLLSYPPGFLARISYADTTGGNPAAIEGVDVGLPYFNGGGGYAADLFGSSIPSGTLGPNVTIRFTGGPPGQKAYRYERCDCSPRTYLIQNFVDVPFTVFDTDTTRQLNVAFLENAPGTIDDGMWDPDEDGQREIIWVMSSPYTGVADSSYFNDPALQDVLSGNIDFLYTVWPHRVSAGATIDAGDKLLFTTSIPSKANDYFTFTTTAPNRKNAALAQSEMNRIRAVPNPYFSHSTYELNQFQRIIRFTHLPAVCTIRLFNLNGDLVRTIRKSDGSSQTSWDLLTDHGLPVGSGIYIFHVDAPEFHNTHVGKLVIFMEKERLTNF